MDIDFLTSSIEGYRQLRQLLTGGRGLGAVARPGAEIGQAAEIRADRYGIRSAVRVDGIDIKFEIVLEARIELESPGPQDRCRYHVVRNLHPFGVNPLWADQSLRMGPLVHQRWNSWGSVSLSLEFSG